MKKKSWLVLSLALTMSVGGSGILAYAEQSAQSESTELTFENETTEETTAAAIAEADTTADNADTTTAAVKAAQTPNDSAAANADVTDTGLEEADATDTTAVETEQSSDSTSNSEITEYYSDSLITKDCEKTAADMEPDEAVNLAVEEIKLEFGDISVTNVTDLMLYVMTCLDTEPVRTYSGVIQCEGGTGYYFMMNSITGQLYSIMETSDHSHRYDYTEEQNPAEASDELLEQNREKYEAIAQKFIKTYLEDYSGTVTRADGLSVGYALKDKESYVINAVIAICRLQNGHQYEIWIDPATDKIFSWCLFSTIPD